ncbi:MAG TPA: hypothetical protein VFK94_06165 [Patescibacteria group bacterium]|nr:hypothetical protein [Patescibacteria group bacterium]
MSEKITKYLSSGLLQKFNTGVKSAKAKLPPSKILARIFLAVGVLALFYLSSLDLNSNQAKLSLPKSEYKIDIVEDGFLPKSITIPQGSKVTFTNKTASPAWPASDPHPTHDYQPGFDPKQALSPGTKWSFIFNETGKWRFHDHIALYRQGEIIVQDGSASNISSGELVYGVNCDGKCFDELIRNTVAKDGIAAAYKIFTDAISQGKELPRNCHWTAHRIGDVAFELYEIGQKFTITTETSYCGFGFYHGFLEGFLRKYPDTSNIMKFCDEVSSQLGKMGYYNCIHGIGHGLTEDPPRAEAIGNPDAMLKPGIDICEKLFGQDFNNLNLCLTGVYTVLVKFADHKEYGISWNEADPFAFCRTQPYRYQKACYGEYAPKMDTRLNWDFAKFRQLVDTVQDEKTKRLLTWVISSTFTAKDIQEDVNKNVSDKYVDGCRQNFTGQLFDICWAGIILGLYSNAEPQKQYLKAFSFCESTRFSSEEKDQCYGEAVREARQFYFPDKVEEVCRLVPGNYKKYCSGEQIRSPYDDPVFE